MRTRPPFATQHRSAKEAKALLNGYNSVPSPSAPSPATLELRLTRAVADVRDAQRAQSDAAAALSEAVAAATHANEPDPGIKAALATAKGILRFATSRPTGPPFVLDALAIP